MQKVLPLGFPDEEDDSAVNTNRVVDDSSFSGRVDRESINDDFGNSCVRVSYYSTSGDLLGEMIEYPDEQ